MIHSTSPGRSNEDACRMAAARLQHDHRHWMIMWGCYTRMYVAFPLFPAPRGTILTASTPEEMAAKMRRQERASGMRMPSPGPASGWQQVPGQRQAPGWQQAPDWRDRGSLEGMHHPTRVGPA